MNSCSPHFYSVLVNPQFICFVSVYERTEHMPHLFAQGLEPGITIVLETPSFLQPTKLQLVSFLRLEFNPCTVFLIQNPLEPSSAILKYPSHLSSVWKIEFFVLFCFVFFWFLVVSSAGRTASVQPSSLHGSIPMLSCNFHPSLSRVKG